jgi:chaperonin cofactor prefoldin
MTLVLLVVFTVFGQSARAQDYGSGEGSGGFPNISPPPLSEASSDSMGGSIADLPTTAEELQSRLKTLRAQRERLGLQVSQLEDLRARFTTSLGRASKAALSAKLAAEEVDREIKKYTDSTKSASNGTKQSDDAALKSEKPKGNSKEPDTTNVDIVAADQCTSLLQQVNRSGRQLRAAVPQLIWYDLSPEIQGVTQRLQDSVEDAGGADLIRRTLLGDSDPAAECRRVASGPTFVTVLDGLDLETVKKTGEEEINKAKKTVEQRLSSLKKEEAAIRFKLDKVQRQATDVIVPVLLAVPLFMVLLFVTTLLFNRETQRRILELRTIVELGGLAAILMTIIVLGIKEMIEKAALAALVGSIIGYVFNQQARRLNEAVEDSAAAKKRTEDPALAPSPPEADPKGGAPLVASEMAPAGAVKLEPSSEVPAELANVLPSEGPNGSAPAAPASHPVSSVPTPAAWASTPSRATLLGPLVGIATKADSDDDVGPRSRAWFMLTIGIASALATVALAETKVSLSWLMVGAASVVIGASWGLRDRWKSPGYVVLGGAVLSLSMLLVAYHAQLPEDGIPNPFRLFLFDIPREVPYNWLLLPIALILVAKSLTTLLSAPPNSKSIEDSGADDKVAQSTNQLGANPAHGKKP